MFFINKTDGQLFRIKNRDCNSIQVNLNRTSLLNPENGFLQHGKLVIQCEIFEVSHTIY